MSTSVKSWEKQLPSKTNFSTFLIFNCSNFKLKQCERLRVTKILKEIKFERIWGKLESKKSFETNSSFHVK